MKKNLIIITTILILLAIILITYFSIAPELNTEPIQTEDKRTECLQEQRNVYACIEIYQPVCATVNIQCITTPCDPIQQTFENSCKACTNSLVQDYTMGECQ